MISGIDLNMKWNDYASTISDTLYLWNGNELFIIAEGTGDNLLDEDIKEGYKDYWMTECYSKRDECGDGGQWMETELISEIDYTIQGVIDRIYECDLWEDDWEVLDKDLGGSLQEAFQDYYEAEARINYLLL